MDSALQKFFEQTKVVAIATVGEDREPWICNVYFASDDKANLYIATSPESNHGKHFALNAEVAFAMSYFDTANMSKRVGVQAKAVCTKLEDIDGIKTSLEAIYRKYPDWKNWLTEEALANGSLESKIYMLTPSYIKFWNDELYGEEKTREFKF